MGILRHFLLLLFVTSVSCCGLSMQYGNITQDLDLEVNKTLTIQCSLFRSPITYENKTYEVTSEKLRLKFGMNYLENVKIVNDLTIEYSVQNAQEDDSGAYSCYVSVPEINKNVFVCSTYIAVGYKPLLVQNFSCISYEFFNLTCTWIKPFNPVHTVYKLYDILANSANRACPQVLNETSCRWTMDTNPIYYRGYSKLNFVMTGKNPLGESKQYMSEDHFKIVIPGVPRNVRISDVTQTSLVIHWSPPRHMDYGSFPPGLQYSILYEPILYEGREEEFLVNPQVEGEVMIENLVPHTEYLFKVRCRSRVVDDDSMWSSVATATAGTDSDVPYLAPEGNPSSFEIEESILGNRTITLYWKGIPAANENGADFRFVIQYHIHHVSSRTVRHSNEIYVGNRTVYSFHHLDTHSAYLFKIYAVNKIGPSRNSSQIVVDKSEKLLERPKDIIVISYGQGKYNLSWKASNQRPYNFTVFWCKSLNPRPYKCEGPLEWIHTTKTKHVLQLPDKNTNYQFAVSANDEGYTSGMSWASCIVYYKGVNYKVKKVEMTLKTATSLKIQWSLECEAQKIVMKEYAIEYCEFEGPCSQTLSTKSCAEWKTVNVTNVSKEDYILGSLKPYTHYLAFIRVHTLSGWSGNSNVACERTMSTAPSDSPRNVKVEDIDGKSITVSFEPPQIPNGIVTRYIAFYNKSDGTPHHYEYREKEIYRKDGIYTIDLTDYMNYYTNYSIELVACVDQACSEKSRPVYAFTDISNPGGISSPRIEVIDSLVNVSWDDPTPSNGPLNYFQVLRENNNSVQLFNVTGRNYLLLNHNCTENDDGKVIYNFRVRAVNVRNGVHLLGRDSNPTKTQLCLIETPIGVIVGIVVGSTAGIIIVTLLLYSLISWMKNEVDMIKGIQIQLPKDLDSPMENPLSSYDKFKNGLQTNHDSGIPCDTSYERLCAFASDDVKDVGRTTEENSQKCKRKSSGRNNSGESTASGKCHDSISSSNTTKTHLSIDSGAEVDSPPSPDGLFSDTSSSHTTPRSYKPDLTIVRESNGSISKDSGLDREGTCSSFINHNVDLPSKFTYFVKKKNFPYSNIQISNGDTRMPSYSKFGVIGTANVPSFIPYSEQSLGLLDSLSNSEPSVADFDVGNGSEPLVPYSKFGLARSAGNGLNMSNQPNVANNKMGYSKIGTVYRALKRRESGNMNTSLNTCPKFLPHNPQTFTALTSNGNPPGKHLPTKENDKAYSKFGVSGPKKVPANGYVSFRDTLTYPSAETSCANQAYSKLGMTASNDRPPVENVDHGKENGIIINAAELQSLPLSSQTSYVPFQNAKVMNLNDSLNKDEALNKEDSLNKDESLCKEDLLSKDDSINNLETEQNSVPNHKPQTDKDSIADNDIDIIIATDPSSSFLDEITDMDSKIKPTNFTISANNDSKGFLIQDESCRGDSVKPLNNIIDDIFGTFDFDTSKNNDITPICINLEDINITNPSTYSAMDNAVSSVNELSAESRNFCKQCDNFATECTCSKVAKNPQQIDLICNGHSEPLRSNYVPLG